jgi:hypothetical protein
MFLDDLMSDGQTQPCSRVLSAGMLGRKERIEDVFEVGGRNTLSRILDFDLDPDMASRPCEPVRLDPEEATSLPDGIHRVQQQIQQDLFDLLSV